MRHTPIALSSLALPLLALSLLAACAGDSKPGADDSGQSGPDSTDSGADGGADGGADSGTDSGTDDTGTTGGIGPALSLLLPDGDIFDPTLAGEPSLRLQLSTDSEAPCALRLSLDGVPLAEAADTSLTLRWDGWLEGAAAPPGAHTLLAEADCDGAIASSEAPLWIVTLQLAALNFTGPAEATDGHVRLAYHKRDHDTPGVTVITPDVPEYWDPDGSLPATWDDPEAPPWTDDALAAAHNLPAAYVAGALPRASLLPGGVLAEDAPALRLVSGDWLADDAEGRWLPGEPIALGAAAPVASVLGRQDLSTTWQFEALDPAGDWRPIPGHLETTHRLYLVADAPALLDGTGIGAAEDVPWVAVLEEIDAAITGLPAETADVLDALRDFIYTNPDYIYNPGDRAYSTYEGDYAYWDWIAFEMTDWLDHNDGADMYCHSTSCFLSVLAGTVGVDAPQYVIGHNFATNLLLPAGSTSWSDYYFYSHSVTSPDGGDTIWDAAVMADGDGDPTSFPVTATPINGVPFEDYFFGLTTGDVSFVHNTSCYLQ